MGKPSIPSPASTSIPAIPTTEDAAVQEAAAEAARRKNRARGYRSTMLSQSMPSSSPALKDTFGS